MADKLFYSYNSTWNNSNSLQYTKQYAYSIVLNPDNHAISYDGKEYGVFHNANTISCLSQNNFINSTNVFSINNTNYIVIKIPSIPQLTNVPSGSTNKKLISFDISLTNSNAAIIKYTISGLLSFSGAGTSMWDVNNCNVLKLSKTDSCNSVKFGKYRVAKPSDQTKHTYWPIIAIDNTSGIVGTSIINISNVSSSLNFSDHTNVNFSSINYDNKLSYLWEIKCGASSTFITSNAYWFEKTVTNSSSINLESHNIWGKSFDGTNDVYGTLTLNSNNKWYKENESSSSSSYILKTDKINVNCDDSGNQLVVAGTGVITSTTYLCSGGGNAYIGVSNTTTDARLNNGNLQAKLYVNGITYVSRLNVNSKYKPGNAFSTYIQGDTRLQGVLYVNDSLQNSSGQVVLTNKPVATVNLSYAGKVEVLASQASGIGLYNRSASHTNSTTATIGTGGKGNWWIIRDAYLGTTGSADLNNKSWRTVLGEQTNVGVGTSYPRAKLHVSGSAYIGGVPSGVQPILYTNGTNYLNGNTGIGVAPNGSYRLYVSGRTYLTSNVGIGTTPDIGSNYRLKVDGNSSSNMSTLFSNGKIILDDEYTFIQKIHAEGLQPHYDINASGSNGILNMYISNNTTTLWHSNYTNSNLGIHKLFSVQAHIHSDYCGLWNMGLWNYRHCPEYGQNILQQTKAGTIFSSVYNATSDLRRNSQLGGLNMILFYHTVKNNLSELLTNINYVFRSTYRNRILFYGSYTDSYGVWHYQSASGSYSADGVKGNDGSGTMDSDYFNNNNVMKAYYGDFGGFVSCIEGNVYNIIVLGVVNLYKNNDDYSWHFNNSNLRSISADTTSLVTSSGLLIYGCWFDSYIGDTNSKNGFSDVVASRYNSIRFRCRVNPDLTWKRHIHVSNTITELHTKWGRSSDSIVGPTAIDNVNNYENHSGVLRNDDIEVQIYMYGPNINEAGSFSFRTISITILGWLYDGDN